MDLGKSIRQSFTLYTKNFVTLFLACLIAGLLSSISFGVLAGPLVGGVLVLCLKLTRGEKGGLGEVFAHFDQFLSAFLLTLALGAATVVTWVVGLLPVVGWIAGLALQPALGLLYFLSLGFVVDQKMKPVEAVKRSIACAATEPLLLWVYAVVFGISAGLGAIVFGIGALLTAPFGVMGFALAYQQFQAQEVKPLALPKRTLQIGGLALGALLVVGLVCLAFGLGRSPFRRSNAGAGLAGRIISGATGQKVEIDADGESFRIGDLSVGTELPKSFPRDIPIYPRAEVGGYMGGKEGEFARATVTLSSQDNAAEIYEYYQAELAANGWEISTSEIMEMRMFTASKDNREASITINPAEGKTDILIVFATE